MVLQHEPKAMKHEITFESFSELLLAFSQDRAESERFPMLTKDSTLEIHQKFVRLVDASDNGTTYVFEMPLGAFAKACCERLGITVSGDGYGGSDV